MKNANDSVDIGRTVCFFPQVNVHLCCGFQGKYVENCYGHPMTSYHVIDGCSQL